MADRPLRRDDYQPRKAMIAPLSARMSAMTVRAPAMSSRVNPPPA